jgi:hypothetical protein
MLRQAYEHPELPDDLDELFWFEDEPVIEPIRRLPAFS